MARIVAGNMHLMGILDAGRAGLFGNAKIEARRLELMRRVADGQPILGVVLWHFHQLSRCDEILQWLVRNRITGNELRLFMKFHCGGSILGTAQEILRRIDSNTEAAPIILGRDYRL